MPLTYTKNKKHIYAWREKNKTKYNSKNKLWQKKYNNWKKIQKIYLNILID